MRCTSLHTFPLLPWLHRFVRWERSVAGRCRAESGWRVGGDSDGRHTCESTSDNAAQRFSCKVFFRIRVSPVDIRTHENSLRWIFGALLERDWFYATLQPKAGLTNRMQIQLMHKSMLYRTKTSQLKHMDQSHSIVSSAHHTVGLFQEVYEAIYS